MAIRPMGDRVVVKSLEAEEQTASGLVVPDTAKEKPQQGKIIEVGNGRLLDDGTIKSLEVRKGDQVLYARYSGTEVSVDGEDYLILREDDILAVVKS